MSSDDLLSRLIRQALYIVLEKEAPDWDERLSALNTHIDRVEKHIQSSPELSAKSLEQVQREIDDLRFQKSSLENSLDQTSLELRRAKVELQIETSRTKELESRLDGIEKRVLKVLRTK
jgi:predicted  nucleic acid-binding Zn-ribbon protein